jgi:hypothetical protein
MSVERVFHSLTRTLDGRLLAAGGQNASIVHVSAEYYDPGSNTWNPTGPMQSFHDQHAAILLNTGKVLIVSGSTTVSELYGSNLPRGGGRVDFNADLKSDIVFENGAGTRWLYYMNGTSLQASAPLPPAAPGWKLVGMGDFDGNGSTDLLWQNTASPTSFWIYLMSGNSVIGGGPVTVAAGYRAAFIADFNGDGKADIVFANDAGARWFFFMSGAAVIGSAPLPPAGAGWTIVGVGDFNGDSRADLLWANTAVPGQYWIYLMNGGTLVGNGGVYVAPGYVPTFIGDFIGADGKSDILWENGTAPKYFFQMNGTAVMSLSVVPVASSGWSIVGVGDFDHNSSYDLLWQNSQNPTQFWIYLLSNGALLNGNGLIVVNGYLPLTH